MTPDILRPRPGEGDVLRIFRADHEPAPDAIPGTDAARTVVLRLADLGGMSLPGYLSEGFDAPDAELMRVDADLRRAEGWALLVPSSALGDVTALVPTAGLEPLAAIRLDRTPAPAPSLAAEGADGPAQAPPQPPPSPAPPEARSNGRVIALAALALAAVVLILVAVM